MALHPHFCGVVLGSLVALGHCSRMRADDLRGAADELGAEGCIDCPEYVALPAKDKQVALWKKITSDEYSGSLPTNFPDLLRVNFVSLRRAAWNHTLPYTFDRFSDENPTEHAKVIHTFGSVAAVRVEPVANDLGFTGMFEHGMEHGLIRLSIVADWTKPCKGGTDFHLEGCFKPSLALKMLRDGDFSSNAVAQVNLGDGAGRDFNFFHHTMGTWLPTPMGLGAHVVKDIFSYASEYNEIGGVGLEELASKGSLFQQDKAEIRAPPMVYLRPHEDIREAFSSDEHDAREDFGSIPQGTALYEIVAVEGGKDCLVEKDGYSDPIAAKDLEGSSCRHAVVGRVVTTSRFVASSWGDRRLFFQHERLRTKGGKWRRRPCKAASGDLPDTAELRMSSDKTMTCSQECLYGTEAAAGRCPFEELM